MTPIDLGHNYSFSMNEDNTKIIVYEKLFSFTRCFNMPVDTMEKLIKELKEKGIID